MSITQIYFQCEKKNGQILFREKPLETTYLCPSTLATDLTSLILRKIKNSSVGF